jgi:hypothetical protein
MVVMSVLQWSFGGPERTALGEMNTVPASVGCSLRREFALPVPRRPAVRPARAPTMLCDVVRSQRPPRNLYYMISPGQTDIGDAIRILRTRAGLTQDELAARAELTAPYLSRVEGGWRDIRWSTLKRLLSALDADLRQLADVMDQQHAKG